MQRWLGRAIPLAISLMVLAGCYTPPRGGVTPYPPGPIDTISILFGNDYSRLCPENYDYCKAGKRSVCCPRGACCNDGEGPYCCDSRGYDDDYADSRDRGYRDYRDDARGGGPCGDRATTCSRGGVTICCGAREGCCADERGLYCCAAGQGGDY